MLKLIKKGDKYWLFEDSEIGLFSPSKFTINLELNEIVIVYENGLKSKKYNVSDCEIYDLGATSPFTTSSGDLFMQKLEELNCPCFQKNENIFNISGAWGSISGNLSDQTDLQTALDSKLNKDTTAGVERVYIINADGSQGTKATSDFKDVLEFADFDAFPTTGETGKIYVALDTNFTYRWSGSVYVKVGGGGVSNTEELYCIARLPLGATNWGFVEDSSHEKSNNIQSITTNPAGGFNFGIQHSAGFSKIGSLVATVDEKYALFGLMIGASVGLSSSLFRITRNGFTIRALVSGGNFSFANDTGQLVMSTDFSYTFDTITGRMVISHPTIVCTYGDMVVLTPYATTYTIKFISKTATSTTFEWYDSSGNLVKTLGSSMKLYFTRTGTFQCTNEQIANSGANFWIRGIFKK